MIRLFVIGSTPVEQMDESATSTHEQAPFNGLNSHGVMPESSPDPYVQFLENWIPGIGECTELHDKLHDHFGLDFSVNSEARLLGFQLGHHPAGNFFHVMIFAVISTLLYPIQYRNSCSDLKDFFVPMSWAKIFNLFPIGSSHEEYLRGRNLEKHNYTVWMSATVPGVVR